MSETITVEFGGVRTEVEAHVLLTENSVNIEFVDYPIVVDYRG